MAFKIKLFNKKSDQPGKEVQIKNKKFNWKKLVKWVGIVVVLALIVRVGLKQFVGNRFQQANSAAVIQTALVETRDIETVLSSSGSIEPLNTYDVKTLVEGEIISADFQEGDLVNSGDVLYQITTDTLDNKIDTANTTVTRAEKDYDKALVNYNKAVNNYKDAVEDYEEASLEYGDLDIVSKYSGIVKTLYVEKGDSIQSGSQIAEIYDNSSMLLEVPFNSTEVDSTLVGKKAEIEITDTLETLEGEVVKVSNIEEALSGNRVVKTVTIQVGNPGGLTTDNTATASVGEKYSSGEGIFRVLEETIITANKSGEIASLKIEEGSKILVGETIIVLDSDVLEEQLESYQKAVDNAKDSIENAEDAMETAKEGIEDAKTALEEVIDSKTDYSITAPIAGKVIRKDVLEGDTISSNSSLCVLYDLSAVVFQMYVDELDVMTVSVGQQVNVTADALEGTQINGVVTNISLESTTSGGVTQYPVTVQIDEIGDLLPGMNVTGEIIVEKVEGVVAVPTDALIRGDVVYVADTSVIEAVGNVPAGFKEVQVETGLTDGDYIEIKSGLTGSEEVYIQRSASTETIMDPMQGGFNMATPMNEERTGGGQRDNTGGANMGGRP